MRLTSKKYNPQPGHNRISWMKVVYHLYQAGGSASMNLLADAVAGHNPPLSCRAASQRGTDEGFIKYCVKHGWLK
jgi:hypothetical protein